jgi:hypothetical protein
MTEVKEWGLGREPVTTLLVVQAHHQGFASGFLIISGRRYSIAFSQPSSGDITGSSCSKEST